MKPEYSRVRHGLVAMTLLGMLLGASGCAQQYGANRASDFCDIFQFGIGATFENSQTGMWPPALGVHAQVSDFVNLGAVHFSGSTAEWDGRGFYTGPESRTRLGFGPMQMLRIQQDSSSGGGNYFKQSDGLWTRRMNATSERWARSPAKELDYEFWADELHQGAPLFHRGWQYWLNTGVELALCDPIFTHMGIDLKLGVDVSEISDCLLGLFKFDFKHDDMTLDEFEEYTEGREARAAAKAK